MMTLVIFLLFPIIIAFILGVILTLNQLDKVKPNKVTKYGFKGFFLSKELKDKIIMVEDENSKLKGDITLLESKLLEKVLDKERALTSAHKECNQLTIKIKEELDCERYKNNSITSDLTDLEKIIKSLETQIEELKKELDSYKYFATYNEL